MTRYEIRDLVLDILGILGDLRPVTISIPVYHTVVIHIAGSVPEDALAHINASLDSSTYGGRPAGFLYIVTAGPLVPGARVGWEPVDSGDDTDDVPLQLLPRAILDDLAVWCDRQEIVVSEPAERRVIEAWQICVAAELKRRADDHEPEWTWPNLRSPLEEAALGEATRRERGCLFVYADGRRRRRVVKLPLPSTWRVVDEPVYSSDSRLFQPGQPILSRQRVILFEHVVILYDNGIEHDEYHERG